MLNKATIFLLFLPFLLMGNGTISSDITQYSQSSVSFPADVDTVLLQEQSWQPKQLSEAGSYLISRKFSYSTTDSTLLPALFLGPCSYSVIIELNGIELYRWGEQKGHVTMTNFGATSIVLSGIKEGINTLNIYLYSDGQYSPLPHYSIGPYRETAKKASIQTLFNLYIIQAIGIIALFSALLFLGFSLAAKFGELDIFYFAFFAFAIFMGYTHFIMNSPTTNDLIWFKISRIGYVFAPYFLYLFSSEYSSYASDKKWRILFPFIVIPCAIYFSLSPTKSILNERFSIISVFYILPFLFFSYGLLIKKVIHEKRLSTFIIVSGYTLFLLGTFNDISHVVLLKDPYFWVTPYGYFSLIVAISFALGLRYYKIHMDLLKYRTDLINTNKALLDSNTKLTTESEAKEQFIKTIAHEFRTPLHGMSGLVQTIIDESPSPSQKENSLILATSFYRFELIVQNLLDYQSLKNDTLDLYEHSFSPQEIFTNVINLFQDSANVKGISLKSNINEEVLPEYLLGDGVRISIVLKNILQNAIKFTEKGSISVEYSFADEILEFKVTDTGCGIPDSDKEIIFNSFERIEKGSFSQHYEGIGLGLAIVDALIKKMKGYISVISQEGKGTSFTVELPVKIPKNEIVKKDKLSILIVDDNNINLTVAKLQLEKFGYAIDTAVNGLEAIDKVESGDYDLVFMDIQMPVMNGLMATQKIKRNHPNLPVIGLTANASRSECLEVGMDDVVQKPATAEMLKSAVITYCQ